MNKYCREVRDLSAPQALSLFKRLFKRSTEIALLSLLSFTLIACSSDKKPGTGSSSDSSGSSQSSSSSVAAASCDARDFKQPAAIGLERLPIGQQLSLITNLTFLPGNNEVMYLLQQTGVIWRIVVDESGEYDVSQWVDLSQYYDIYFDPRACEECGLYSLAFHPDFDENGYFYLSFTEGGRDGSVVESYITRFRSDDNGETVAFDSDVPFRENIYHVTQPNRSHNNGQVKFGPDGYLYFSLGDGGPAEDPQNHAQNINTPFGAILRVQDDGTPAPGNLVEGGLPELFAYGLRNPWHWTFDRLTGALWAGDVGQADVEEVNIIENGGNYGWKCQEGMQPTGLDCNGEGPFIDPVWDYSHIEGASVTGGYVYRGSELSELYGKYIFSDFGSGVVWGLSELDDGSYNRTTLISSGKKVSAFAEDHDGELYLLDYMGGEVFKIVPAQDDPNRVPIPEKLSLTGCVDQANPELPAERLIPYDINEPFWSDGAEKSRYMSLSDDLQIQVNEEGDFDFPVGTVLVKNFALNGELFETRLLLHQENTGWSGFTYAWDDDMEDATLVKNGLDKEIGQLSWHYPTGAECSRCHTFAAGFALGPEVNQLNKDFTYATGETLNQLDYLGREGLFVDPIPSDLLEEPLPDSADYNHSLTERARSYLHSNCSGCHRPGGTSQSSMDLRYDTHWANVKACNQEPHQGDLGIQGAKLVVPGDHQQSILWHRIAHQDEHRMPPLASNVIDQEGANLVADWIDSLEVCETIVGPIGTKFNIRNRWTNMYIYHDGSGDALTGDVDVSDEDAQWVVEPGKYLRIRNVGDPAVYLHNQYDPEVSAGPMELYWWSAQWYITEAPLGYHRIRNRWKGTHLHMMSGADGGLLLGNIADTWHSAMWRFEPVEETVDDE